MAASLLAGIQGGVGIMLSTGDLSYLEAALDVGIASIRRPGPGAEHLQKADRRNHQRRNEGTRI